MNLTYRHLEHGGDLTRLSDYEKAGGWASLRSAITEMDPEEVLYSALRS